MLFNEKCEVRLANSLEKQKERKLVEFTRKEKKLVRKVDADGNFIPVLDENKKPKVDAKGEPIYELEEIVFEVIIENLDNPRYLAQRIAPYINLFSSIGEFGDRVLDTNINDIPFPEELKDFVQARTYRIDPANFLSKDQKKNSKFKHVKEDGLSISEWYELLWALRSYKRVTTLKNMTTVGALKKNVAYADVESRIICKQKVHFDDVAFVPIELDSTLAKASYGDNYFTHSSDEILDRWFAELKWTSNRD